MKKDIIVILILIAFLLTGAWTTTNLIHYSIPHKKKCLVVDKFQESRSQMNGGTLISNSVMVLKVVENGKLVSINVCYETYSSLKVGDYAVFGVSKLDMDEEPYNVFVWIFILFYSAIFVSFFIAVILVTIFGILRMLYCYLTT